MTDTFALERYAETRDPEAFAHLVASYQQMVYATCLRTLGNTAEAEDAAQDTFVKLAKSAGDIRTSVAGWLHRAATTASLDRIRSASRRRGREAAVATPERVDGVRDEVEWAELRSAVDEALAELHDDSRTLVVERYLVGRTQVDLAAEHGVSASMMSRKVAAAVEELRSRLQSKGFAAAAGVLTAGFAAESMAAVPAALGAELIKIGVAGVSGVAAAGGGGTVVAAAGGGGASAGLIVVGVIGGALLAVAAVIVVALLLPFLSLVPNERLDPVTTTPPPGAPVYEAPSTAQQPVVRSAATRGLMAWGEKRVDANAQPVDELVEAAYDLPAYRVVWETPVPEGRYDTTLNSPDWQRLMLDALSDEFDLVFTMETRSLDGWTLRLAPGGKHRLKASSQTGKSSTDYGQSISFRGIDMPRLAGYLSREWNAPVVDETGMGGRFEIDLPRRRDGSAVDNAAAVAKATGLRIEPNRQRMEVLVVREAEGPE